MIRVAMLGAGRIGQIHAANIAADPRATLVAVADPIAAASSALADRLGSEATTDAEALIARPDVDAVVIGTPSDTHARLLLLAARAGKAVLCEKPLDNDLAAADTLIAELDRLDVPVMLAFNRRFDPSNIALKRAIDAGEIGDVRQVIITSRDPGLPPREYVAHSGGIFRDMVIHDFDMARFLLGEEPVELFATASRLVDPALMAELDDHDTVLVVLRTASGRQCVITCCREASFGYDQRFEVLGSRGMLQNDNLRAEHAPPLDGRGDGGPGAAPELLPRALRRGLPQRDGRVPRRPRGRDADADVTARRAAGASPRGRGARVGAKRAVRHGLTLAVGQSADTLSRARGSGRPTAARRPPVRDGEPPTGMDRDAPDHRHRRCRGTAHGVLRRPAGIHIPGPERRPVDRGRTVPREPSPVATPSPLPPPSASPSPSPIAVGPAPAGAWSAVRWIPGGALPLTDHEVSIFGWSGGFVALEQSPGSDEDGNDLAVTIRASESADGLHWSAPTTLETGFKGSIEISIDRRGPEPGCSRSRYPYGDTCGGPVSVAALWASPDGRAWDRIQMPKDFTIRRGPDDRRRIRPASSVSATTPTTGPRRSGRRRTAGHGRLGRCRRSRAGRSSSTGAPASTGGFVVVGSGPRPGRCGGPVHVHFATWLSEDGAAWTRADLPGAVKDAAANLA